MSDYNEEQNKVKNIRRGVIEQRPVPNKNKRDKLVEVEYRTSLRLFNSGWQTYSHRYRTVEEAEMAVKVPNRKYSWSEYRVKEAK